MNTKRKTVRVHQCDRCDNTFLMVGSTPVGMAQPRKVGTCYNTDKCPENRVKHPHRFGGTCPSHQRKLSDAS